jgi:purine-nucleoside phosphorylase
MSLHIEAKSGEIAKTILITGDPLRAKHHAEAWLEKPFCYNRIRGMFGYTGTYLGKAISIQGTGMGIPSTALYIHELINEYKVTCIIRVGTCGAIQKNSSLGQVILATESGTDSSVVTQYLTPSLRNSQADSSLINQAKEIAQTENIPITTGSVFSTDLFYSEDPHRYEQVIKDGVLAVDMETSMLYAMSAYFNVRSISLLTVSDNIITGKALSAEDREKHTTDMIKLALKIAASFY